MFTVVSINVSVLKESRPYFMLTETNDF